MSSVLLRFRSYLPDTRKEKAFTPRRRVTRGSTVATIVLLTFPVIPILLLGLAPTSGLVAQVRPSTEGEESDSLVAQAFEVLETGELEAGRQALMAAVPVLPVEEATWVIQLANMIGRLDPESAARLVNAELLVRRGVGSVADSLALWADPFADAVRAPLLAHAARLADRAEASATARAIRELILEELPDHGEAGEAALLLAQSLASTEEGVERAIEILETLITERPNSAVAPTARVELGRLKDRSGGGQAGPSWRKSA